MSKERRHHNTKAYRSTKRDKRWQEVRSIARRLRVPFDPKVSR